MQFVLRDLARLDQIAQLPGCEDAAEAAAPVLREAAAFASEVLSPLNQSGDKEACTWRDGAVTMPAGFTQAFRKFAQAGWIGLGIAPKHGGQGLPQTLAAPVLEMWHAANPGFANAPLLNQSAIEAIALAGSPEQKDRFIPPLVTGKWLGTMALTEPQAGSDLGQLRTQAVPEGDRYRIKGQKIFITFGEHDMTENIVHLVLARLPAAPPGTQGISMFVVPKFLIEPDGSLGERNDVHCAGIEHKLGLNANPTCTMNYGERTGAIGYMIGRPNEGLRNMFVMMNAARFSVAIQALAIADRAYQKALAFAQERVQFKRIVEHPDVRRMLVWMKAQLEAMRALAYVTAASMDRAAKHPDRETREMEKKFVDLMTPVLKGWCTETAVDICSTALQVFGGIGYIEETGIAQQLRDVRVTTIYEGTTGIQALDLAVRKIAHDNAAFALGVIDAMREHAASDASARALDALREATLWMSGGGAREQGADKDARRLAAGVPYLKLFGMTAAGLQLERAAKIASQRLDTSESAEVSADDQDFYRAKIATSQFYADHVFIHAPALAREVIDGGASVMAPSESQLTADRR